MSQSHEQQLVQAIRAVCGAGGGDAPSGMGGEIVKAIREEIAPLVELAATPQGEYMNEKAASLYSGIPVASLQSKRSLGKGPAYIKDCGKVLYSRKDIDRYMEQRKVRTCGR